eukprot:1719595-Pyramimonas_sp.AAC.1
MCHDQSKIQAPIGGSAPKTTWRSSERSLANEAGGSEGMGVTAGWRANPSILSLCTALPYTLRATRNRTHTPHVKFTCLPLT